VLWTTVALALFIDVAGLIGNLYDRFGWYDIVVHTLNFFAFTLLVAWLLAGRTLTGAAEHPALFVLTVVVLGLGLGAFWELAEWVWDLTQPENVILGKFDTMVDFVADTVGALAAGLLLLRRLRA
jgi:uncharacterized membrane protein YjdF